MAQEVWKWAHKTVQLSDIYVYMLSEKLGVSRVGGRCGPNAANYYRWAAFLLKMAAAAPGNSYRGMPAARSCTSPNLSLRYSHRPDTQRPVPRAKLPRLSSRRTGAGCGPWRQPLPG